MKILRIVAGLACIAATLVALAAISLGALGGHAVLPNAALIAHLPNAAFGLALLCVGVWLLKQKDAV